MSLINDALKKAQRQRTEGTTPPAEISSPDASQEPLHRVARREKPAGFRSQLMLIGGGAVATVVLLTLGAFFFFRPAAEQPATPPKPTNVASASPATPAAPAVSPAASIATVAAPSATLPTPSATPVNTPLPPPQPVVAAATPVAAPVDVPAPAPAAAPVSFVIPTPPATASAPAAAAPTPPASTVSERPKPSTRMIGVIEHFRVGGIRVAGADSKVLMNDRVYRINDIVDFELSIRLTAIETKALTFEDARGAVHVRTF